MYWAVLSHSVEVLTVLCAHVHKIGADLNVSQPDHTGTAPLDIAVASQQWHCVKVLLNAGGLEVCQISQHVRWWACLQARKQGVLCSTARHEVYVMLRLHASSASTMLSVAALKHPRIH